MRISIRQRLTAWYAAALLLGLGIFALGMWVSLQQRLIAGVDARLTQRLQGLETALGAETDIRDRTQLQQDAAILRPQVVGVGGEGAGSIGIAIGDGAAWGGMLDVLERLDIAVKRIRQFTSDASHELRTPLALIRATAGGGLGPSVQHHWACNRGDASEMADNVPLWAALRWWEAAIPAPSGPVDRDPSLLQRRCERGRELSAQRSVSGRARGCAACHTRSRR